MRAERLLRLLLLLQAHGRMPAVELARRLEVSVRTIQRDMDALSVSGVPVSAQRGGGGGWMLDPDYRTGLTGLTASEATAIFVGKPAALLADLGLDNVADGALIKLLAALPASARKDAEYGRDRVHVDVVGWDGHADDDIPCLGTIQQGLWEDRRLRLRYGAAAAELVVAPLGLVAKGGIWYLVASRGDAVRTYRVSRVREAELTDERFERPRDFDLPSHWRASSAAYVASHEPRYRVELRVRTAAVNRLGWDRSARVVRVDPEAAPAGWREATMCFENEHEALRFLLGMGGDVAVLAPPELRGSIVAAARQMIVLDS